MTTTYKKKLIEVAIPLEAINEASAREKSIRHGHPSTLHLWWARRPLAACRAVLFAQLVDDPSSNPDEFPTHKAQEAERKRLFGIIEELVKWENSTNEEVLDKARAEIRKSCGDELPPVYDPFSGGGSIPFEAQRLGLPAYGSDLNPVAVMIGKAMIEIPPRFKDIPPIHPGPKERQFYRNAEGLAEDVKYYGEWMREKAWERIGHLYPCVDLSKKYGGGSATVIAWIWARTVPSPDPAFSDVQVPVSSSFLLSSKKGKETWIQPVVDKSEKTIEFRIRQGGTSAELEKAKNGTKAGQAMFRCLFSDAPISGDYIDKAAETGRMGVTLLAIVAQGKRDRVFIEASASGPAGIAPDVSEILRKMDFENLEVPCRGTFASNAQGRRYGFNTFRDYFTSRQLVALGTYSELVGDVKDKIIADARSAGLSDDKIPLREGGNGIYGYAEAVAVYLNFGVSRLSDIQNSLCRWESSKTQVRNLFGRQAIPMMWDFGENNVFGDAAGDFRTSLGSIVKVIERFSPASIGFIKNADAQTNSYPSGVVISTDPPYYDNIEYADLSDFFYVWLRKGLRHIEPDVLSVLSTPKAEELVATRYRHGGQEAAEAFFLNGMRQAVSNMSKHSADDFPATIYYAFKQSEIDQEGISSTGWATFLQAVVEAGYSVVGTWPMRTEMANRMVASGTNALANSVVLVCRKRQVSAEVVTRAEFIRALKRELPPSIAELQAANIAPADMPQSAIGPGMGVFSRFEAVLEAGDSPMSVKSALQLINAELDEYLGGIQGEFDPDTRFAITWFEQHGMKAGDYGSADNLARARGISVDSVKHAGIVESAAGKVRLLSREELDEEWEPDEDDHITIWECLQHLVRLHEKDGLSWETIRLMRMIGDKAEAAKDLAYCLYDISANKRKDAKEATAYNAVIADWTELSREAAKIHDTRRDGQAAFDL